MIDDLRDVRMPIAVPPLSTILTCRDAEATTARAQQLRYTGIGYEEHSLRPVSLSHRYLKITAISSRIQITDFKRARRHRRLIDHVAVLANFDFRVSLRHTPHDRSVSSQ
ncbi:hypothetical protein WS83_12550 [Burkholderia sp. MSMB2042]|nr:hypothetical protein WS83_12550 [Burkholderia sp. MSMB2042]